MSESKRRAIGERQKQARRQALLDIAWELFLATDYGSLTIAEIAARAGLAKGTVYLYFATKEELFLAIQERQLAAWFDDLHARFAAAPRPATPDEIARLICASLDRRSGLVGLLAILHTVLEHNIDLTSALRFKHLLLERLTQIGAQLEACLPSIGAGNGPSVLLQIYALIIGVEHLARPAPVVREALRQPGMEVFDIAFEPTFAAALRALLRGTAHPANT